MKTIKTILFLALATTGQTTFAQTSAPLKVVMAMNQGDSLNQRWLTRQLYNLKIALPEAEVEVVCYSAGLRTLIDESCYIKTDISRLQDQGIVFAACENSMGSAKVTVENLVPRCTTVKAGIAELVLKQSQDWQYVDACR